MPFRVPARTVSFAALLALIAFVLGQTRVAAQSKAYFPPPGEWQRKAPGDVGMDAAKLKQAVDYALSNGSAWDFERDQVKTFGTPLGPLPEKRAATNGIILRHGYIVAEFGDTQAADPSYSVAKSFLSTVAGIAVDRKLIRSVNDPVVKYIHDGGYDSSHNRKITWKNHLQQESEWEGILFSKSADFVGHEPFGAGERTPRAIQPPGSYYEYNDVRINRLSLSLLRLFGRGLPEVLKTEIMDPIGTSPQWKWIPYDNSTVDVGTKKIPSVSGGTRWGGGLWIGSQDLARFGLLILNHGKWDQRQLVSEKFLKDAVTPSVNGPDYGYLWWLNTRRKQWPHASLSSFAAIGNGGNIVWIDPEHDIVLVWRWHAAQAVDGMIQWILASLVSE